LCQWPQLIFFSLDAVPVIMKSVFCIAALFALILAPVVVPGQSSADYQERIRRATESYRGDCVEASEVVVYSGYYIRPVAGSAIDLSPFPFVADPFASVSLQRATSNQTMKLTATFPCFGDAFPVATFILPKIGLSPSGRSLSFSR
jgi:hypothetical protein